GSWPSSTPASSRIASPERPARTGSATSRLPRRSSVVARKAFHSLRRHSKRKLRIGLFTDGLVDRPLDEALDWLAVVPEVRDVEIGTGAYSPAPHADLAELGASAHARRRLSSDLHDRGFRLAALNVSGNPLGVEAHDRALRETIRLAAELEVDRVVCMSGGRADLAGAGWFPGVEEE